MHGLTDALLQFDPLYTATWYMDFGAAVEEIYELGTEYPGLEHACYNPYEIYRVIEKLPYRDVYQIFDKELEGGAQLEEILSVIERSKANARRRALDVETASVFSSPTSPSPPAISVKKRQRSTQPKIKTKLIPSLMEIIIPEEIKTLLPPNKDLDVQAACWSGAKGVERAETADDPLTADPAPMAHVQLVTQVPMAHVQLVTQVPTAHVQLVTQVPMAHVQPVTRVPVTHVQLVTLVPTGATHISPAF